MAITVVLLVSAIIVAQGYVVYPAVPRHLKQWQQQALFSGCQKITEPVWIMVGSAPGEIEAEDYSREIMGVLNKCHLTAVFGYDPAPTSIVTNDRGVVVPPDINSLKRVIGLQLWVFDLRNSPSGAIKLSKGLSLAGIPIKWRRNIRLRGTAISGDVRMPIIKIQCVLFVGRKPGWGFGAWYFTEKRHLLWLWRERYPQVRDTVFYDWP